MNSIDWATIPDQFSEVEHELRALRYALALVPRPDLCVFQVSGDDRIEFLHRILSQDVRQLTVGEAAPAALLTPKGRVVSTLTILLDDEQVLCVVPQISAERFQRAIEGYIVIDEVTIEALSLQLFDLFGVSQLRDSGVAIEQLAPYQHRVQTLFDTPCRVLGDDHLATLGLLVMAAHESLDYVAAQLAERGAIPVGTRAYEVARIEAGTPRMDVELSEGVLILEAGQMNAVSFNKGCYIGQEPVCRIHNRGQVNHLLVGFRVTGERIPARNEGLHHPDKEDAGHITSAAFSAACGGIIALGYVHRKVSEPGTVLNVAAGGQATVTSLPHLQNTAIIPRTLPIY